MRHRSSSSWRRTIVCVTLTPLLLLSLNVVRQLAVRPAAKSSSVERRVVLWHRRRGVAENAPATSPVAAATTRNEAQIKAVQSVPTRATPFGAAALASNNADNAASPPPPALRPTDLNATAHVELWGAVVQPGTDNIQPTPEGCADSCRDYVPNIDTLSGAQCNTYVWSEKTHVCWLKYQQPDALSRATEALRRHDPHKANLRIEWWSGVWLQHKPCTDCTVPTEYRGCISKDLCNTTRSCGSPAVGAYAKVDTSCLLNSPTAQRYQKFTASAESRKELVAFSEQASDYDGLGVRWGIGHKKHDWQACEQACRDFSPHGGGGPFGGLPCNVWTWCSRKVCWEPDAHSHSFGDCWLKFSESPESPEVNMRTPGMRPAFMQRHRVAMAEGCPWVSGVLLVPGTPFTNGTWGPRAFW